MATRPLPYTPINCEFHDLLESLATLRKRTHIVFRNDEGATEQRDATIVDIRVREGAEFVELDSGDSLRLDHLIEVDGRKLADY
jgi:Rho-binding antiterminator